MKKDLNKVFEELLNRYINSIEKIYKSRYKKAKDKEFVEEELKKATDFMHDWLFLDPKSTKIFDAFWDRYKRGEDVNQIISDITEMYGNLDEILPYTKVDTGKKITLYISEEQRALKAFALDERKLLKFLIRATAYKELQKRFPTLFDEKENTPIEKADTHPIKWTGKKDNKNEFVQLVYGLHEAGLINQGQGEITKITETLAKVFNVDLGKGWQTNHSSSIHNVKNGYQPPIFHKIQSAYEQYAIEQVESKKKKK